MHLVHTHPTVRPHHPLWLSTNISPTFMSPFSITHWVSLLLPLRVWIYDHLLESGHLTSVHTPENKCFLDPRAQQPSTVTIFSARSDPPLLDCWLAQSCTGLDQAIMAAVSWWAPLQFMLRGQHFTELLSVISSVSFATVLYNVSLGRWVILSPLWCCCF